MEKKFDSTSREKVLKLLCVSYQAPNVLSDESFVVRRISYPPTPVNQIKQHHFDQLFLPKANANPLRPPNESNCKKCRLTI